MTARVKVAMALRRSTRNSLAIMALNVLTRVGRGTGRLGDQRGDLATPRDTPGCSARWTGGALVVVVVTRGTPVRSG